MQRINDKDSQPMEALGWDDEFWEEIGLGDLIEGRHAKIGILMTDIELLKLMASFCIMWIICRIQL